MKMSFFGDSYDIVKHALLRWLASMGPWVTHPMFTEEVSPGQLQAYQALLGTKLVSSGVLTADIDRREYLVFCNRNIYT